MADNPINLATLQQQDPYITEILGMATQVQLYNYNKAIKNEWDKTDVSGALFVYQRSACPIHGMMILNKQTVENWVEPITDQLEFQVEIPFLLYRSGKRIQGIWFYKPTECKQVGDLMQNLREEAVKSQQSSAVDLAQSRVTRLGPKNVDIMQILSGAQQRYENKTKGGLEPINISTSTSVSSGVAQIIKPTPLKLPDGSSSNGEGPSQLQALFKNVKLTQQLQQRPGGMVDQYAGDPPPDVTINPFHNEGWSSCRSLSVTEVESGAQSISSAPTGGLTVEEIERQQREQIQTVIAGDQVQAQGAEGGISQVQSTKELLHLFTAAAGGDGHVGTLPAMPQFYPTSTCDKGSKEATILSAESSSGRPAELLTPSDFGKQLLIMPAIPKQEAAGIGQPCPDVLLTPLAFVTPQRPASSSISPSTTLNPTALLEQLNNIQRRSPASPGFASPPPAEITPLTRQQLQQALIYIIRTDEDFVSRLHEAYLASFQQQLAGSSTSKR